MIRGSTTRNTWHSQTSINMKQDVMFTVTQYTTFLCTQCKLCAKTCINILTKYYVTRLSAVLVLPNETQLVIITCVKKKERKKQKERRMGTDIIKHKEERKSAKVQKYKRRQTLPRTSTLEGSKIRKSNSHNPSFQNRT